MIKNYTPEFSFSELNGEKWILDHGMKVARFDSCSLCDVKLKPQGEKLIKYWTIFWLQYKTGTQLGLYANRLRCLTIYDEDPEKLRLNIVSLTPDGSVTNETWLTLTYDAELESYVYDVEMNMVVSDGKTWRVLENNLNGELEYCNLYPYNVDSSDEKRWQVYVYQHPDGNYYEIPHNHLPTPSKRNIQIKNDGIIGYFNEHVGNPTIQIFGDAASKTLGGLCPAMYDIHLAYKICSKGEDVTLPSGTRYHARYRVFQYNEIRASEILKISKRILLSDDLSMPRYEIGVNSFEVGVKVNETDTSWYWKDRPGSPNVSLIWDKSTGHSENCALKIVTETFSSGMWDLMGWGPLVKPGRKYRITAYVKTENLIGKGAYLAYSFYDVRGGNTEIQDGLITWNPEVKPHPQTSDVKLTGTNDWRKISLTTSEAPPDAKCLNVKLCHSGKGTSWFDDVQIEEL